MKAVCVQEEEEPHHCDHGKVLEMYQEKRKTASQTDLVHTLSHTDALSNIPHTLSLSLSLSLSLVLARVHTHTHTHQPYELCVSGGWGRQGARFSEEGTYQR